MVITVNRSASPNWWSSLARLRVADEQGNVYDARWGSHTLGLPGEVVHGWQVRAFPRRSESLGLEFLAQTPDGWKKKIMHGRFSVCCSEGPVKTVRPIGSAPARTATQSTPTAIAPRTATRRIRFIALCFLRTSAGPQHWECEQERRQPGPREFFRITSAPGRSYADWTIRIAVFSKAVDSDVYQKLP